MPFLYPDPSKTIANAISAQRALTRGTVHFSFLTLVQGKTTAVHGDVSFIRGSSVTVRLVKHSMEHDSDRIYKVQGGKFSAYDYFADEAIARSVPESASLTKRLGFVLGAVPDPVKVAIDPDWVAAFLHSLPSPKSFSRVAGKGGTVLRAKGPHKFETLQLGFDKAGRLSSFVSKTGLSSFQWSASYCSNYHPQSVPVGGGEVKFFTEHEAPPTYANGEARTVCVLATRAFRSMRPTKVIVDRPGKETVVYWDRGKLRQSSKSSAWAYDGKVLTVIVNGSFYRGKANHADVLDYLAFLTNGEDSFARTLLLGGNILQTFLSPTDTVRVAGSGNVLGAASTFLQINGPGGKSSLVVRIADRLIASTETDNFGSDGKVAFHDECKYRYVPFHGDASFFTLQSKKKAKPLPKNAIQMGSKYYHPELQFQPAPMKKRSIRGR